MLLLQKIILLPSVLLLTWLFGYGAFVAAVIGITPLDDSRPVDAIVVTTGGNKRIEAGLELFAQGRAKHLFITGVHPDVTKGEITAMWKHNKPLPDCCITLGHRATTTIQNAAETLEWLTEQNYSSIILVTSNYHMTRAWLEHKHMLPGVKIILHPITQPEITPERQRFWLLTFSEYNKSLFRVVSLLAGLPDSYAEGDI